MRSLWVPVFLLVLIVGTGCAITDYPGRPGEKTEGSAKLYGMEIAFAGFDPDVDGTYGYVVSYNLTQGPSGVTIDSLRNPVLGSFSRDGVVNRDGDDVQGRAGVSGGRFHKQWTAVDNDPGSCQFFSNITFSHRKIAPGVALCQTEPSEETDKDLLLQESFASLDDLFSRIWSRDLTGEFTMEATSLILNGVSVPVESFPVRATAGVNRPIRLTINRDDLGSDSAIRAILENTRHRELYSLGFEFAGGMRLQLPQLTKLAFDHDVLRSRLN